MKEYTILICDDEKDIRKSLEIYLAGEGYNVATAENGAEALEYVQNNDCQLVLLDVMMPVMDGIITAVKIRQFSNIPIIFLSAKSEDSDRILGLNMGADDYVTKPFNPVELFARIKSNLRRYAYLGGMPATSQAGVYSTGGLVLDDNKKLVTVDGEAVTLTAIEYNILRHLIKSPDRVFSSGQIYEAVWNEPAYNTSKIISVHIRHIREKIEAVPNDPKYLKVIYGFGYKVVTV